MFRRKKFDIHRLDSFDFEEDEEDLVLEEYQDALLGRFLRSPEGKPFMADPNGGFWTAQLVYYGYVYIGVTLPQMTVDDVKEVVMELFPRKISLLSPEDADGAIPELVALWEYLKREYRLPAADEILEFLRELKPDEFKQAMSNSSRFGMAKSLVQMAHSAGFDVTNDEEMTEFMYAYNASLMAQEAMNELGQVNPVRRKSKSKKSKKKRKAARAARKRQRKKRR